MRVTALCANSGNDLSGLEPAPQQAIPPNRVTPFTPRWTGEPKIIKTRGHFPTEDAARKLIYLAIQKAEAKWKRVFHWPAALAAFKIEFGDRIPDSAM